VDIICKYPVGTKFVKVSFVAATYYSKPLLL